MKITWQEAGAWSLRAARALAFLYIYAVVLEVAAQALNRVYPLERPQALKDTFKNRWLSGDDETYGRTRLYTYLPVPDAKTYGHPVRINHWGFRGREFKGRDEEGPDTFRVLVLGDSITMGQGIAEETRYTDVLERKLKNAYPDVKLEVINLGVQGYETIQEYRILTGLWPVVRPDQVVVGFCLNDPNLHYRYYPKLKIPCSDFMRNYLEKSILFRIAETHYDQGYRWLARIPTHEQEIDSAYNATSGDWAVFCESVKAMGDLIRQNSDRQPVVMLVSDLTRAKREGKYDKVRPVFEANGFLWAETPERFEPVSRFENHPGVKYHAALGEALFRTLAQAEAVPRWLRARKSKDS